MFLEKSQPNVTSYTMRFTRAEDPDMYYRCMWARINLDHDNFILSATTDCGNYLHQWPSSEHETFMGLLCGMTGSHLHRKIAKPERCKLEDSKEATIQRLIENSEIDPKDERLDRIRYIEDCGEEMFRLRVIDECSLINDWDDVVIINDYAPGVHTFIKLFVEYLRPQLVEDYTRMLQIDQPYYRLIYGDKDGDHVKTLDKLSGMHASKTITDECDSEASTYGVFKETELIGYCSLNYADACDFDDLEEWNDDARYLTNVFIKEEYRGRGYGLKLVSQCIENLNKPEQPVFLSLLNIELQTFFEKMGFREVEEDGYTMVMV